MIRLALPGAGLALFALACGCVQTSESSPPGPIVDASTTPPPPPDDGPALGALACNAADGAVTPAPADTDAAVAPSGPYLWRNVAIVAGGFVTGIVFSRAQPDVVYARTDIGGAYRWNAATARWMPLLDWIGRTQTNLAGVESIVTHRPATCFSRRAVPATRVTGGRDGRHVEDGRRSTALAAMDGGGGARDSRGVRGVG